MELIDMTNIHDSPCDIVIGIMTTGDGMRVPFLGSRYKGGREVALRHGRAMHMALTIGPERLHLDPDDSGGLVLMVSGIPAISMDRCDPVKMAALVEAMKRSGLLVLMFGHDSHENTIEMWIDCQIIVRPLDGVVMSMCILDHETPTPRN